MIILLVSCGMSGADGREIKMAEEEDAELTSFHEHIKIYLTYEATLAENNLEPDIKALLQPRL